MAISRTTLAVTATLGVFLGLPFFFSQDVEADTPLDSYKKYAEELEIKYELPRGLLRAIIAIESRWRPHVKGMYGELGIAQIKPSTALRIDSTRTPDSLFNPYVGMELAARYLVIIRKTRGVTTPSALGCLYNAGEYAKWCSVDYVSKLDKEMRNYRYEN